MLKSTTSPTAIDSHSLKTLWKFEACFLSLDKPLSSGGKLLARSLMLSKVALHVGNSYDLRWVGSPQKWRLRLGVLRKKCLMGLSEEVGLGSFFCLD